MIVKNEERVLGRCLDAAQPLVDHTLIVDTGSSDGTVALARARAVVIEQPWRDFGHNRTQSFKAAAQFDAKWLMTIDADMRIVCPDVQRFREFIDKDVDGFSILQINRGTEYHNIRIMRRDAPWVCKGATHEFWACRGGVVETIPRDIIYIDDVGDGGAKSDKFERDELLLRKELEEEPTNERDVFYLANTLLCQGKLEEAAELYAKRVDLQGWEQEVYFAAYQLVKIHARLERPIECEMWAQRASETDPDRNEAMLALVEFLRERGEYFKAWHYLLRADRQKPSDKLFLEADCYEWRVAYERSVVHYYISPDRAAGMRHILGSLPRSLLNLPFYAQQLQAERKRVYFDAPEGFWAGSVSVNQRGEACVRTADYWIEPEGGWYRWRGSKVTTRNFRSRYDPGSRSFSGFEEVVNPPPLRDAEVVGLEDVRLYGDLFTATQKQWTPEGSDNLMAIGTFHDMKFVVAKSERCEKNWLLLPDRRLIYAWSPLVVGKLEGDELRIHECHSTPRWWEHLRGSASPFRVGDRWIALAHIVVPKAPREYFSVLVELEPPSWRPKAWSLPFYFLDRGVEYCLSAQVFDEVHFFVSRMDRESYVVVASIDDVLTMLSEK